MKFAVFVIFFFIILIPLILGIAIPVYKKHYKTTSDTINHDSTMRKYVYKTYLSKKQILDTLKTQNVADELTCILDLEQSTIIFSEYGSSISYTFGIMEYDGYSILRLSQVPLIGMSSHIPYKLNPYIINKLNAEIIPFSQYEF